MTPLAILVVLLITTLVLAGLAGGLATRPTSADSQDNQLD
jgi:hypothetical protein